MTSLLERPVVTTPHSYVNKIVANPAEIISTEAGHYSILESAQAYFALAERHIPLCDAAHTQVTPQHKAGCQSPGKVPLVRDYPRFAAKAPTPMDIVRMFGSHLGALVLRCYTPPYQHKVWLPVPSCLRCGSAPV